MDVSSLTFPVCSFKRVFDTAPLQEVLTLSELVACFRRFELKPQLHQKIERELSRIDRALEQALGGQPAVGERLAALIEAGVRAKAAGADPTHAVRARAEHMRVEAKASAKRDLRLWSPVLYREGEGVERGSEHVTHVTCLVLDYDKGVRISEALALWQDWFHCVHTTWSHTPEHPKFRVIFPLAAPVPAAKWETMWSWAERQSQGEIDVSMKGVAATYSLPAVPHAGWPREAITHAAPLLDPRELGIDCGEPPRLPVRHAPVSMLLGDPEKEYVVHETEETVYVYDDPEASWDAPDPVPAPVPAPAPAPVPEPDRDADESPRRRETVCVDFDGVIHSYRSGWLGGTVIPDPPVPGAIDWLTQIAERYEIAILSTRTAEAGAVDAMREYLRAHGLAPAIVERIHFARSKPPARIYVDDRGWRFEGTFPSLDEIRSFRPWIKKQRLSGT